MEWQDKGLILGVRKHGETSAIIEIMTRDHGRHMGLVRGGRSKRMRPILQPGNMITASWHARLEEHLGTFSIEAEELRAAKLMESQVAIYGIQTLATHLRLLPERDPHLKLYDAACVIMDNFEHPDIVASLMVRFEVVLLEELGFGLDLTRCAGDGDVRELAYVSPKSGRAVSRSLGQPWHDKMLGLPGFLNPNDEKWAMVPKFEDIDQGFRLCSFFLERHVYGVRGIKPPDERIGFQRAVARAVDGGRNV